MTPALRSALRPWALWSVIGASLLLVLVDEIRTGPSFWTLAAIVAAVLAATGLARQSRIPASRPQRGEAEAEGAPRTPSLADLTPFMEALPEAALLIDRSGRVAGSNKGARRQLQFEAIGLRLSAILRHPDVLDAAQAAAEDGATRAVDYETSGPVEEHFRVYVAPIAWAGETAALLIFHDQTAQILTERMRADFVANASHELKTPVTSLSLMVETLTGPAREDAAARERFFALMAGEIDRMRRLIDDLLSLSKIELNEHVPPSDTSDLAQVVREVTDALSPVAREAGVKLSVTSETSGAAVVGDKYQLAQVARNLIDNALKYAGREGEVEVEVGLAPGREEAVARAGRRWDEAGRVALLTPPPVSGASYVYLRVSDNGPGIARRYLPRLSERFFRVEREQAKTGTGLGLAIVRHIVNRHRGGFIVESQLRKGSAFAVYLQSAGAEELREAAE